MEPQITPTEFQNTPSSENEQFLPNPEAAFNTIPNPEAPILSPEIEKNAEQLSENFQTPVIPVPQQVVTPEENSVAQETIAETQTPATARDEDLIEKEWITKVKSIINTTSDDPYKQQSMMSQLVADYVLKRYGREIGKVEE